jgi:FkbM family methyltransferase
VLAYIKEWNRRRKWRRRARRAAARRERLLSFGKFAGGLLVEGKYGMFAVDAEDDSVGRKLLQAGSYGESDLELARSLVSDRGSVLMVGTHIGALAVPLSRSCGKLVAVEANPRTFRFLKANLLMNECSNVVAHNVAAGDESGRIKFLLSRDNSGGAKRLPKKMDFAYVYDKPEVVEVRSEPLDSLLGRESFELVFMDIEGSEVFALKGMQKILSGSRALVVEFVPHHLRNVAGVTVQEFLAPILPHFDCLYVPKRDCVVAKNDIAARTTAMYDADESHDGLVFLKSPVPDWLRAKRPCDRVPATPARPSAPASA